MAAAAAEIWLRPEDELKLIKVAARVIQSTRRIVIELSSSWPHWDSFVSVSNRAFAPSRAP